MLWKTGFFSSASHWFVFLGKLSLIFMHYASFQITSTSNITYMKPSPTLNIPVTRTTKTNTLPNFTIPTSLITRTQTDNNNTATSLTRQGTNTRPTSPGTPQVKDHRFLFYLKIGGWITLGVVITGLVFLAVTHYISIRHVNRKQNIKEPFCFRSRGAR